MVRSVALIAFAIFVVLQLPDAGAAQRAAPPVDFGPDDPVKKDPQHYKVEFENEHVRVVRVRYGPREPGMLHEHRCGRVNVHLTALHQTLRRPNGETAEPRVAGGTATWSTPDRHADENLENTPIEVVYVDVKGACPSIPGR